MGKIKITGMEIKTAKGEKHALTMEEARELYKQLHEMFGEPTIPKTVIIERDFWPWYWPPYYGTPVWSYTAGGDSGSVGGKISGNVSISYQFEDINE